MPTVLALAVLVVAGVFAARTLRRFAPAVRRRIVLSTLFLPLASVAMIAISDVLGVEALGWIGGLSLMFGVPVAIPFLIGAAIGWVTGPRAEGAVTTPLTPEPNAAPDAAGPSASIPVAPLQLRLPLIQPHQIPVLLLMLGVAAGFWVVIGVGFRIHDDDAPFPIDEGLIPAMIVLVVVLAIGLRALVRHGIRLPRSIPRPTYNEGDERAERHRRWLADIAADPRRRVYAERIAAGDTFWDHDRVEYDLDPRATTCCAHLAPLERAMRDAGVQVRLQGIGQADARAVADERRVREHMTIPEPVRYEEMTAYDRSANDPPVARWRCTTCASTVWVVHPDVGGAATPTFPLAS